jgi:hypothetical protein
MRNWIRGPLREGQPCPTGPIRLRCPVCYDWVSEEVRDDSARYGYNRGLVHQYDEHFNNVHKPFPIIEREELA